ncbi:hypothetical protein DUI87_29583 [Hirundo rustica rustica]|uniref:Uncharacterized protein n=1 Tax=Hirundo rustica rustica TaxID=333673 RepID=A0A3M0JGY8_HIRRU|nr:hypothetical protein DUI87_29583 [Hirundo rustica rustica]
MWAAREGKTAGEVGRSAEEAVALSRAITAGLAEREGTGREAAGTAPSSVPSVTRKPTVDTARSIQSEMGAPPTGTGSDRRSINTPSSGDAREYFMAMSQFRHCVITKSEFNKAVGGARDPPPPPNARKA